MKTNDVKWYENLFTKKIIIAAIIFMVFILSKDMLWSFYDERIVIPILSKVKSHWLMDIIMIILTVYTLLTTIFLLVKKHIVTPSFYVISLILFLMFIYCRYYSHHYTYEHYFWFERIKYLDYLLVFFCCLFIVTISSLLTKTQEPNYSSNPFFVDKPITHSKDDKFERKDFAKKIAEKMQSKLKVEEAGALAIGINGAWGSGKTSFTNLIKSYIDNQNRILINFNPWRSSSASKIIEDFFQLLINELKQFDVKLSTTLSDYAKSLTRIEENAITKATEVVSEFLFDKKNKNEVYDSINDSITKIKKQIIIFIDDLDRLDKNEIIEVLRIIRNTANFNNVIYVVSYDKEYINTAIKLFNEYNYKSFLEKIFQFEFTLPLYETGVLRSEIKKLLRDSLGDVFNPQIERSVDSKIHSKNFTNEIVKTYRDVVRLVNSFLFEFEPVKDEVYFFDFYLLQLLKLEHKKVYESLIDNKSLFLTADTENKVYRLKTKKEAWQNEDILFFNRSMRNMNQNQQQKGEEDKQTYLDFFLNEHKAKFQLNSYDIELITLLIKSLIELKDNKNEFGGYNVNRPNKDADLYKSFAYPSNFHKYFAFRLYEGDISSKEFEEFRRKPFEQYNAKAFEWINKGMLSELLDRLDKVEEFETILEFENHIKLLLEIGRYQLNEQKQNSYWLDYSLLLRNLKYPYEYEKLRVYRDIDEYRNFLKHIFEEAPKPQVFESNLIARILGGRVQIVLNPNELSDINFEYFKEYCNSHTEITTDFRQLHSNSIYLTDTYDGYAIKHEAEELFLDYFKKYLDADGLAGFIRQSSPGQEVFYMDNKWLLKIFGTWDEFESYLTSAENIKSPKVMYDEFIEFYDSYKANNKNQIGFIFQHLGINRWR